MRPITVTAGPLASADADGIAQAQNPASTFTLNGALVSGGVAQLGAPRRVLITTTDDETSVTVTVTGTNRAGDVLSEALAGVNTSSTYTTLDFFTVTSVTNSTTLLGNVTIGTNGIGGSPWVMMDPWAFNSIGVTVGVIGTVNYDIEITGDDPNDPTDPVAAASMIWFDCGDAGLVAETANASGVLTPIPRYARILLNSGSGSVRATFIQPGVVPE
jgi:hypothetical protein